MPFVSSVRGNFGLQKKPFPISDGKMSASSSGGTITTAGGYRIHTFTSVGSSTFTAVISEYAGGNGSVRSNGSLNTGVGGVAAYVEYFVLAGGGSGSSNIGGGGGAGGFRTGSLSVPAGSVSVTVGGGAPASAAGNYPAGNNGDNSVFSTITSLGGGRGGRYNPNENGTGGGSGGGGGGGADSHHCGGGGGGAGQVGQNTNLPTLTTLGGAAESGQGHAGGRGGIGGNNSTSYHAGNGGNGLATSITGSSVTYGGGGGGGGHSGNRDSYGGSGGGTNGHGTTLGQGPSAANNTGAGSGCGHHSGTASGAGGSGIVVVRYTV